MRVRWIGLTLALVLLGAAVGYAVGGLRSDTPATFANARPVPAHGPSIPVLPTPPFAADIGYPALEPGLHYATRRIGSPPYFLWTYDAPAGWVMTTQDRDELRWRPPTEPEIGGYSLRVKLVNENKTTQQMVEQKRVAVLAAYDDVEVLGEDEDSLYFSYRETDSNTQRFNRFHWFTAPGSSEASFEMSVVGRRADIPGLTDLYEDVVASVQKAPPA